MERFQCHKRLLADNKWKGCVVNEANLFYILGTGCGCTWPPANGRLLSAFCVTLYNERIQLIQLLALCVQARILQPLHLLADMSAKEFCPSSAATHFVEVGGFLMDVDGNNKSDNNNNGDFFHLRPPKFD